MAFDYSAPLMQWKEPSFFQQNKKLFYFLSAICTALLVLSIVMVLVIRVALDQKDKELIVFGTFFVLLTFLAFSLSRRRIVLMENGIVWSARRRSCFKDYSEIGKCWVRLQSYPSAQFFILEFLFKDPDALQFILPKEVNENSVLELLRNKGVNVIETSAK